MPDNCYRKTNGVIKEEEGGDWNACSNHAGMCCEGMDPCLSGGICYSPLNYTNKITYYVSGCTDSTFKDSACINHCGDENFPNIKWQDSTNQWACCGASPLGQPGCVTLSNDTFSGPTPSQLDQERQNLGKNVAKLAIGAIIGIVVGAVLCLAASCFIFWRCCCSRGARDKRNRGKFIPLGVQSRGVAGHEDVVWNANVHDNHDAGYGYGGAPYHPPNQGGPQYTVGQFR